MHAWEGIFLNWGFALIPQKRLTGIPQSTVSPRQKYKKGKGEGLMLGEAIGDWK